MEIYRARCLFFFFCILPMGHLVINPHKLPSELKEEERSPATPQLSGSCPLVSPWPEQWKSAPRDDSSSTPRAAIARRVAASSLSLEPQTA